MTLSKGIDIKTTLDKKIPGDQTITHDNRGEGLSISPEERMAKTESLLKRIDAMRASIKKNEKMSVKDV